MVDPVHMLVDDREATAGSVMFLAEMCTQHALAEVRVMPGDFSTCFPRFWYGLAFYEVYQVQY
jgi:hypothetical protein